MRPKKTPLSKSTTGGDKCALEAALREHRGVVVIEGYQTARSACAVGLTPVVDLMFCFDILHTFLYLPHIILCAYTRRELASA